MTVLLNLLLSWLANPQVLAGLGIAGGALFLFLKGRSSGEASVEEDLASAAQELNTKIHSVENANQKLENKKNDDAQNIDSITDPDELVRLLNAITNATSSDPSNKK